jgi:hypothetical protein
MIGNFEPETLAVILAVGLATLVAVFPYLRSAYRSYKTTPRSAAVSVPMSPQRASTEPDHFQVPLPSVTPSRGPENNFGFGSVVVSKILVHPIKVRASSALLHPSISFFVGPELPRNIRLPLAIHARGFTGKFGADLIPARHSKGKP